MLLCLMHVYDLLVLIGELYTCVNALCSLSNTYFLYSFTSVCLSVLLCLCVLMSLLPE